MTYEIRLLGDINNDIYCFNCYMSGTFIIGIRIYVFGENSINWEYGLIIEDGLSPRSISSDLYYGFGSIYAMMTRRHAQEERRSDTSIGYKTSCVGITYNIGRGLNTMRKCQMVRLYFESYVFNSSFTVGATLCGSLVVSINGVRSIILIGVSTVKDIGAYEDVLYNFANDFIGLFGGCLETYRNLMTTSGIRISVNVSGSIITYICSRRLVLKERRRILNVYGNYELDFASRRKIIEIKGSIRTSSSTISNVLGSVTIL